MRAELKLASPEDSARTEMTSWPSSIRAFSGLAV
jgi:hypothetical protein